MIRLAPLLVAALVCSASAGCQTPGKGPDTGVKAPDTVEVARVVDLVKAELEPFVGKKIRLTKKAPPGSVCSIAGADNVVLLDADTATLTLQAMAESSTSAEGAVKLVVLKDVFELGPSASAEFSRGRSQEFSVAFDVGGAAPKTEGTLPVKTQKERPLAAALVAVANGLLDADHSKQPCLIPKKLTATISFDVATKGTGGLELKIFFVELGGKHSYATAGQQKLEFEFSLEGSTPVMTAPP